MKGNFIKYIFIVFIIAIIIAVIYEVNKKDEVPTEDEVSQASTEEEMIKDIVLGVSSFDTINPILSQNKHIQEISRIIYEPLFELDSEYKLQKCLVKESQKAEMQAIGAGALNQAVKAVAIARGFVAPAGVDLVCIPAFAEVEVEGEDRTGIKLIVESRK